MAGPWVGRDGWGVERGGRSRRRSLTTISAATATMPSSAPHIDAPSCRSPSSSVRPGATKAMTKSAAPKESASSRAVPSKPSSQRSTVVLVGEEDAEEPARAEPVQQQLEKIRSLVHGRSSR